MIQRPPACKRHAADLPGTQRIVAPRECPWCWAEEREAMAGKSVHHKDGDLRNVDPANLELREAP